MNQSVSSPGLEIIILLLIIISLSQEAFGAVYCMTAAGEVVKIDSKYLFPNGIAVQHSPEGVPQVLLVAETGTKSLWAYNITGPGQVSKKTLWGKLPGNFCC